MRVPWGDTLENDSRVFIYCWYMDELRVGSVASNVPLGNLTLALNR